MNHLLTVLGFAHICGQPYFTHLMAGAFYRPKSRKAYQNEIVLKLCIMAGIAFFSRYVLAVHIAPQSYIPMDAWQPATEWIRSSVHTPGGENTTCTFSGKKHLAWALPMYQPSYFTPSCFLHCFMMFAPFLVRGYLRARRVLVR